MRQFGVLTSYDHTFFLQRQMLADGTETMMVSRAVARDAQSPTVYQCLAYLCDIADSTTFQCSLPLQCQFAYDKYLVPDDAILSEHELSFDKILGSGKFHVYHELRNNWAVKAIDLPRQQKYLLKFWNEIKMYQQLKDLQGDGIPQLKLYGYWQGGKYFMAFTICGRVPQSLTLAQKKRMVEILDQVHAKDVLQGSIKTSNMLVDEDGRVYLIDFERGKTTTSNYRKAIENQKMVTCMNGLRFS
ncbi:hypothetical protein EDD86DRAFT_191414 [Gorgonomyces haynaldii]|nr:hypothetical protein EDD86DRAFT_191414 [Gorgonomyces haynaldii]